MSNPSREEPIRDVLRVVLRHRKKVITFVAFVTLCTSIIVLILPPKFGSEAKLLVLVGRESVSLDPVVATGKTLSVSTSRETEMNTLLDIMQSREVLSKIVDKLGAETILKPQGEPGLFDRGMKYISDAKSGLKSLVKSNIEQVAGELYAARDKKDSSEEEKAILALSNSLSVSSGKQSTVITVESEARSPEFAQMLVSAMVDVYSSEHMKLHSTTGSEEFFRDQKQLVINQLTEKRAELSALRSKMGIGTVVAEYDRLEKEKAIIESLGNSLARDLAGATAMAKALQQAISSADEVVLTERAEGRTNVATDGIRQQLYALEIAEGEATGKFTEGHPELKRIRAQLALMRERFDKEETDRTETTFGRNQSREQLMLDYEQQKTRVADLQAQYEVADGQLLDVLASLQNLNQTSGRLDQLAQDVAFLERSYDTYSDSLEQSRIGSSITQQQISNVNVVQPATYVSEPTGPNRMLLATAGMLVAILGAIPLALVFEYFDQSLRSPADVEAFTNLPVLAAVPRQAKPIQIPEREKSTQDVS